MRFRFTEDALQLVDGHKLQSDDPANPNDDLATSTERVMLEFSGRHVDVKLRESLDGERTNLLEENIEAPWQERQKFKVDFETSALDPIVSVAWFYGEFLNDCARRVSAHLVPGSFEWDEADQYLSFVLEVNYLVNVANLFGPCYDLVSLASGVGTSTIRYKFSFYRPGPSNYRPEEIAEKAPVNKRFGAFQVMNLFRDGESGLLSAKTLLQRWDPMRETPVTFYFVQGFPERFKPMFQDLEAETNSILEAAGAKLRFRFKEWNDGGVERKFGDLRYSFVAWHQDIDTTRGLLGYGPSSSDPRTGEVLSANLNLYNVGMDYYRFLIEDFLELNGGVTKPDSTQAWEEIACTPGETAAPADDTLRLRSTLFGEMRRVMDLPEPGPAASPTDDFLPTPARGKDAFLADYRRVLGEYRYVEPSWNPYVYLPAGRLPIAALPERLSAEREFQAEMAKILMNENPFGRKVLHAREGIAEQLGLLEKFRGWKRNHDRLKSDQEMLLAKKNIYVFDAADAVNAMAKGARRCTAEGRWESNEAYRERIIEDVVSHVAIHEFGHNLGLRHNFYGSVDAKHTAEGDVSSSVMDYVVSQEEAGSARGWGAYDRAAISWIYGDAAARARAMGEDYLYCTDEHRFRSALCAAHDLGVTPSQIVLNAIERYDWLYELRNRRRFRTFWDTSRYVDAVYGSIFDLQRMWYLGIFDWSGGGVQDTLKRLDQVDPAREVLDDQEYDAIAADFYNDMQAAIGMTIAFYDAVINQPASFRNYQTEYDPYFGDVLRLGIIVDKLFATFAFMDLQEVYNYDPNVYEYVAMYDAPFGEQNQALAMRVLDNMLGASYDTFPWFQYYALGVFAEVTNTNLVANVGLRERIAIRRYEDAVELGLELPGALEAALAPGNTSQAFVHAGEEYVYTYLRDQGWHLVASKSRSPVSHQYMRDYNEALNAQRDGDLDTYGLKILLAYYEYFNNFVGF